MKRDLILRINKNGYSHNVCNTWWTNVIFCQRPANSRKRTLCISLVVLQVLQLIIVCQGMFALKLLLKTLQ